MRGPRPLLGCWLFCVWLLSFSVHADPDAPERIVWNRVPVAVELTAGHERLVHFPEAVRAGVPAALQGVLRVQNIGGTLYLLAAQPFAVQRMIVHGSESGQVYLLDLTALAEGEHGTPIEIHLPDSSEGDRAAGAAPASGYGYVTLTRFAAQQLYAPARLLRDLPGVVREPVRGDPVALVRGNAIKASPLIAWRAGNLHLSAVLLVNQTKRPQVLDARALRGQWLAATFQHNRLHAAGSEADRTVVYLLSERPFAAALR